MQYSSKLDACEISAALGGSIVADAKGNYLCHCPAHTDQSPSLAIRDNGRRQDAGLLLRRAALKAPSWRR